MRSRTDDDEFNVFSFAMGFLAASLLITTGIIATMYGASELLFGFGRDSDNLLNASRPVWGVLHVVAGLGLFAAGCNLFVGKYWARMVGLGMSLVVLLAGLLSFDEGPVFAVFLVVLNGLIFWSLLFNWKDLTIE